MVQNLERETRTPVAENGGNETPNEGEFRETVEAVRESKYFRVKKLGEVDIDIILKRKRRKTDKRRRQRESRRNKRERTTRRSRRTTGR